MLGFKGFAVSGVELVSGKVVLHVETVVAAMGAAWAHDWRPSGGGERRAVKLLRFSGRVLAGSDKAVVVALFVPHRPPVRRRTRGRSARCACRLPLSTTCTAAAGV